MALKIFKSERTCGARELPVVVILTAYWIILLIYQSVSSEIDLIKHLKLVIGCRIGMEGSVPAIFQSSRRPSFRKTGGRP